MTFIENDTLEFKREYTQDIRKEIVAFSNSQGGTIIIGVEDDGKIIGVPDADKVMLQIAGIIQNAIKPDISLFTECRIEIREGKQVVVISVQRGSNRPDISEKSAEERIPLICWCEKLYRYIVFFHRLISAVNFPSV